MEEDLSVKIEGVLQTIELIERKTDSYRNFVISNIEALQYQLENSKHLQQNNPHIPKAQIIAGLTEGIKSKKPLTNIEQKNKDFYKYISKLGKKIETLKTMPEKSLQLYNSNFDHKALKEAIAEFIIYYAANNMQNNFNETEFEGICDELGVVFPEKLGQKLVQLKSLKIIETDINYNNLQTLMEWINQNLESLIKINSRLPFLTFKIVVLDQYFNQNASFEFLVEILKFLMEKIYSVSKRDIDALFTALCAVRFIRKECDSFQKPNFWMDKIEFEVNSDIQQKYVSILRGDDLLEIKELFLKESEIILEIPRQNPLFEVFRAGVMSFPHFIKFSDYFNNESVNEEVVGISFDLEDEFTYHSLIVCPVSKEICTPDNPPVVLTCGHVISDSSAKKLAQGFNEFGLTKKFKCPVCPEEQIYSKIRVIKLD